MGGKEKGAWKGLSKEDFQTGYAWPGRTISGSGRSIPGPSADGALGFISGGREKNALRERTGRKIASSGKHRGRKQMKGINLQGEIGGYALWSE